MGRLSSIEEVEQRNEQAEAQAKLEAQRAQEAEAATRAQEAERARAAEAAAQAQQQAQAAQQQAAAKQESGTAAQRPRRQPVTADEEADFHGLSESESLGTGHKALVVAGVVVLIAIVGYILNYWLNLI